MRLEVISGIKIIAFGFVREVESRYRLRVSVRILAEIPFLQHRAARARGKSCLRMLVVLVFFSLLDSSVIADAAAPPNSVGMGAETLKLTKPWRFHLGDNPAWESPSYDDSAWETVDLTPLAGAHDSDVGLTGFVPGWGARGHRGYSGYAWYRIRVASSAWNDEPLALAGPPAVDYAYQLFLNGKLLGGCGVFSRGDPTVFSIQPRLFKIPISGDGVENQPISIAVRVWMPPWGLADETAGGIRIAPAIGPVNSVARLYQTQWDQTIRGYIVDAIEAAIFLILAGWTLLLAPPGKSPMPGCLWLVIALVLTAFLRGNQAVFFWTQVESVQGFELTSVVLLAPLGLAAWTMTWRQCFGLKDKRWIAPLIVSLTLALILAQFFARSWFYGVMPTVINSDVHSVMKAIRWLFLGLTVLMTCLGSRKRPRGFGIALAGMLLVSIGQFAPELSSLGIKSIWFPFGTGVSRTQFAYAAFDLFFLTIFLRRIKGGIASTPVGL